MTKVDIGADTVEAVFPSVQCGDFTAMMRCVPGAVAVIATQNEGERRGLTATAVCSVSAAPPQMLICVNRESATWRSIEASGAFSINFLDSDHKQIARLFSQPTADPSVRFSVGNWIESASGAPALTDAVAFASCVVVNAFVQATHIIFIGRVVEVMSKGGTPLIYHDRQYRSLKEADGLAS